MPSGFRLSLNDCLILMFAAQNPEHPYDKWPEDLKVKAVEKLRRRGLIHRSYWPTKYGITRRGFGLVELIKSTLEHSVPSHSKA